MNDKMPARKDPVRPAIRSLFRVVSRVEELLPTLAKTHEPRVEAEPRLV